MLRGCDYRRIEPKVDDLLQSAGLPLLDHGSVEFGRVARRLLLAMQEVTHIESERWNGIYTKKNGQATGIPSTTKPAKPTGPLFSKVARQYLKEVPAL